MITAMIAVLGLNAPTAISAADSIPLDAKLEYNQGVDYYKLGLYDKAIKSFRNAIKVYPDYNDGF